MKELIRPLIDSCYDQTFDLYRDLHAHPELSGRETRTGAVMAEQMAGLGLEVTTGVGGQGVVGILRNGDGPTLMIRADMDGLPITEETGLDYASTRRDVDPQGREVGVMHACGHDVHMTVLTGTARVLAELTGHWQGTLLAVAQPAEETAVGAKAMIADGLTVADGPFPRPDFGLACHVAPRMPAGIIACREGHVMAAGDFLDVTIHGQGGHGARPQTTKDPIVMAAQTILAWQTIVSREVDPIESAVVSVGSIHGGGKHNIIPDQVRLQLTVRTFSETVRDQIIGALERIARGVALQAGLPPELEPTFELEPGCPAIFNHPELTRRLIEGWRRLMEPHNVIDVGPMTTSEDFSFFGATNIPLCYFFIGTESWDRFSRAQSGELTLPEIHTSRFVPQPEPTLKSGIMAMAGAALDLLKPDKNI
jgi:hippurate hydrolase